MKYYREATNDRSYIQIGLASNNAAEYQLMSSRAHDLLTDYLEKFNRWPSSAWYHRHFDFEQIKQTKSKRNYYNL